MTTKIPLRPSLLKRRRESVKWIILHHTSELYDRDEIRIDNDKYQMSGIYKGVLEKKEIDVNYHFVIEKIKGEYNVIMTRPFVYLCEFDDIPAEINRRALHIGILGNMSYQIPQNRLYEVLAFRVINPLLRLFNLSPKRLKLHRDISINKDISCPGDFIDEGRLISQVRRFVVK